MPDQDFEKQLQELRQRFIAQLPAHMAKLEEDLGRFRQTGDGDSLRRAQAETHVLTGSGRTFGAAGISRTAKVLDELLVEVMQGGSPASEPVLTAVDEAMVALRGCVASVQGGDPNPCC